MQKEMNCKGDMEVANMQQSTLCNRLHVVFYLRDLRRRIRPKFKKAG
ncbi:hypothetical protein SK36_01910 [Citrobacter sp. MGH106]|nr:hypothetical protein SK36_01910 [Citrobacter sp. MGH106]